MQASELARNTGRPRPELIIIAGRNLPEPEKCMGFYQKISFRHLPGIFSRSGFIGKKFCSGETGMNVSSHQNRENR
jgi:hypothetical protein